MITKPSSIAGRAPLGRKPTAIGGIVALAAAAIVAGSSFPASAQDDGLLANACTSCHGVDGRSEGAIPSIAGMDPEIFLAIMQAFRSGNTNATIMGRIVAAYSDEQLQEIAAYFAAR